MTGLLYLIPVAIGLGAVGLAAFLWALRSAQFEDLDGAANRILFDDAAPEEQKTAPGPVPDERPSAHEPHEPD